MTPEALRRVVNQGAAIPLQTLPASALVGVALPFVLLSAVLNGMDIQSLSLLSWIVAVVLIAFALPLLRALATTAAAIAGALLLLHLIRGAELTGPAGLDPLALALTTALAWGGGCLLALLVRERAALLANKADLTICENALAALFEHSRDCIKLLGTDGKVLAINQSGLRLAGASGDSEMLGHNWFSFWDNDLQKTLAGVWDEVLREGSGEFGGNCRILSGERRYWQNHFSVIQLQSGQSPYVLCISRDITDSLNEQQTLKSSAAQLSSLATQVDDAFCSVNSNWQIQFANAQARRLLVADTEIELVGRSFWEFFSPAKSDEGVLCLRRAMERQSAQRCEYFSEPRQAWLRLAAFPHAAGIGVLLRDLSANKAAEKQAAEENARLQVAQDIAGFGDWSFNYDHGQLKLSPRAVALLGLVECPPHEHKQQLLERLYPQDRMALVQAIINSSAQAPRLDLTVRMPGGSGDSVGGADRHIHWIGQLMLDQYGNPQRMMGAVQDVSTHLEVQAAIDKARALVRNIIDVLPQAVIVVDQQGRYTFTNNTFESLLRVSYGDQEWPETIFQAVSRGGPLAEAVTTSLQTALRDLFAGTIDQYEYKYHYDKPGGARYSYIWQVRCLDSAEGKLAVLTRSDISSVVQMQEAAAQNERQMRELLDNLSEAFWSYDLAERRFNYFSLAAEKLTKVSRAQLIERQNLFDYIHPDDRDKIASVMSVRLVGEDEEVGEISAGESESRLIDADGELHWIRSNSVPIRNERNEITSISGITRDITASKQHEQQLLIAAFVDDVTGLPNRKALLKELSGRVESAAARPFALLLLNLDRFKNINDALGYRSGDLLLSQTGRLLRAALYPELYLARFGGDEFAVICPADQHAAVAATIRRSFDAGFELASEQGVERAIVTVSIGIARCPQDSDDADDLLRFADVALRRAKVLGRNNSQVFEDTMMLPSRERLTLENELRSALKNAEFELFYQGKFDLAAGELVGAEALLRWRSPSRGLVSPADFVPLLEETGLILSVGEWVLAQACAQVRAWHQRCGRWLPIAVNVSALQVVNGSFGDNAVAILRASGLPAAAIELEITESALMSDAALGGQLINRLKAVGYTIALDDFGTGYSNLSYLRQFAPNTLKIDRSFVAALTAKNSDRAIVAVILQLAAALELDVVAEGIETLEQQTILGEMNCRFGQGYLLCKPLPVAEFERQVFDAAPPRVAAAQPHSS
jgi:diguanylate cyclase (GGDEF)-like protein/PAS domain S-box-containing protein